MESIKIALPLTDYAIIRQMTGEEEDLLLNKKLVDSGQAINRILTNCTLELNGKTPVTDDDILQLKSPDRQFMLIELRKFTLGDSVPVRIDCGTKDCGGIFEGEVDLNELPMIAPKEKNPDKIFETIVAEKKVKFVYMDGNMENRLMKQLNINMNEQLTLAMVIRIKEVEGVHPTDIKSWVKGLGLKDRNILRAALSSTDCGYDTEIEGNCPNCGRKITSRVEQESGFYLPQM